MPDTKTEAAVAMTRGQVSAVKVRSINEKERTATFVAATERGVDTMWGREYLQMKGIDLERFEGNPVVLDAHNRYEAGAVIGNAEVEVKGRQLIAVVTFANTARAEEVWSLVKDGFLKALSVGFVPRAVTNVAEDESFGTGRNKIDGPARVVTEWELFEISVVPVPADADALRREVEQGELVELRNEVRCLTERLEGITNQEANAMADTDKDKAPDTAGATEERNEKAQPVEQKPTDTELLARNVMAICPDGLEHIAKKCLLEGKSFDEIRAALLEEHTKNMPPVGTPEPAKDEGDKSDANGEEARKLEDIDDKELARALCG